MSTPSFKTKFYFVFVEDRKNTTSLWKIEILRNVRQVEVHFLILKSELEDLKEKEIYALPLKQNINSKQKHKQCILEEMLAIKKNMYLSIHRMPNIEMLPLGRTATNHFNKHGYLNSGCYP